MQMPHSISKGRGLEDDGVSDEFFHYLWTKDELNFSPPINIPDTVFMKYGQPTMWYFTSKDGKIKRKHKQNLNPTNIEESFKKHPGYDVVASFITIPLETDSKTGQYPTSTVEYLDLDGLKVLLFSRNKETHGILQRFIEPKATRNEMIRAVWSPKVCLIERGENVYQLHDKKYSLYERCVTFEGPHVYYRSSPLRGPVLAGQIQKLCEAIVAHISDVSFSKLQVTRMAANFKVDSRDKVWLLYTTSIRCNNSNDTFMKSLPQASLLEKRLINMENVLSLPENIVLSSSLSCELVKVKKRLTCLSCNTDTVDDKTYPVHYKSIIKQHEYFLNVAKEHAERNDLDDIEYPPTSDEVIQATNGVGFGCLHQHLKSKDDSTALTRHHGDPPIKPNYSITEIPPMILNANPKLDLETFTSLCDDSEFLQQTINLCESCCLVYSEFSTKVLILGTDMRKLRQSDVHLQNSKISSDSRVNSKDDLATFPSVYRIQNSRNNTSCMNILQNKHGIFHQFTPFIPSESHINAKNSSIGLKCNEEVKTPSFPATISFEDRNNIDYEDYSNDILAKAILSQSDSPKKQQARSKRLSVKSSKDSDIESHLYSLVDQKLFSKNSNLNFDDIPRLLEERQRLFNDLLQKYQSGQELSVDEINLTEKDPSHDEDQEGLEILQDGSIYENNPSGRGRKDSSIDKDPRNSKKRPIIPAVEASKDILHAYKYEIPYIVKGKKVYDSQYKKKIYSEQRRRKKLMKILGKHEDLLSLADAIQKDKIFGSFDPRHIERDNISGLPPVIAAHATSGARSHLKFLREALDEINFEDALQLGLTINNEDAEANDGGDEENDENNDEGLEDQLPERYVETNLS